MSADVIDLASRHKTEDACYYCRPGFTCGPHRLVALAGRLEAARGTELVDEALTDALAVIERIAAETLHRERTAR